MNGDPAATAPGVTATAKTCGCGSRSTVCAAEGLCRRSGITTAGNTGIATAAISIFTLRRRPSMTDKDRELQELRRENKALKFEIEKLKHEISKWEHCHRQDMADNLRLRNQIAMLMGWDPVPGGTNE